jgi:ATP-binding cassette subfamily B protein RaxB
VQSIRLFQRTEERRVTWTNLLAQQFNAELRIARITISFQTANTFLFGIERVAIVWLGALAVLDAQFSVGMLFAFMAYRDQFVQRTSALIDKFSDFRLLRLHGERVADILLSPAEPGALPLADPARHDGAAAIEFRGVSFRYSDADPFILKDLSLTIHPGQSLAITGVSGSGKTTLVKLLLGLLEPRDGTILVDGIPLQQMGLARYRASVGAVMQDDHLFAGTIAENISFFDPSPDRVRMVYAARLASLDTEIATWPMAYETLAGEGGIGLSGGQRQRACFLHVRCTRSQRSSSLTRPRATSTSGASRP